MPGAALGGDRCRALQGITADDVRAQLGRVLASADFDASERNRRFLSHIVEEKLAGRGDRIKAYGIAIVVFERGDSFDPQSDPIVRVEASRLRRSLERYSLLTHYGIAPPDDEALGREAAVLVLRACTMLPQAPLSA